MKKLLAFTAIAAAVVGAHAQDFPQQAHQHRGAFLRRRPDRPRRARPGRGAAQAAGRRQHRDRQRARRRQLDRRRQGGARQSGRLHAAPEPHRHVDHSDPGAQRALQGRDRLRVPRHRQRRADDADRQAQHAGEQLQGTDRLDRRQQGQDQPRQRRRGLGLAPVRPALPERDQDRDDAGALQGHGARHHRPDRRPDRPAVRPDHQHLAADRGQEGQGLSP